MNKHNFAQQVLRNFRIKMFAGNKQILDYKDGSDLYPQEPLKTRFVLHRHVSTSNKKIIRIDSYEDLLKMGFQISRRNVQGKYFRGQKVEYYILKIKMGYVDFGAIPKDHLIEFNVEENWLRLVGTNSSGRKVFVYGHNHGKKYDVELDLDDYHDLHNDFLDSISPFTFEEKEQRISIDDIPWILTDDGKLVCLPKQKNLPKIGIFGRTGTGKTLFMHMMIDNVYMKWNKRCIIPNDSVAFQTRNWSLPWDMERNKDFTKRLEILDHKTRPLPCVYLFPQTNDLNDVELEEEASFRISLPFKDIISNNPEGFFDSVENLGQSGKYLGMMINDDKGETRPDGLIYAKTIQDVHRLVNEQAYQAQTKIVGGQQMIQHEIVYKIPIDVVRTKLFTLMKEIFNARIFDVNTNVPSKWIMQMRDGESKDAYPWRACLYSDVVPVIVTSNIRGKKYFPAYFRFILEDLRNMQEEPLLKKNEIELWMFPDEIHTILKYPPIMETFTTLMKEGRPNRIAFCYATQYFGDIPEDIQMITDYIVSFGQSKTEGAKILDNFDYMKYMLKTIKNLPKYHAIVAAKAGAPLAVYDTEGNKEIIDDGTPFKGIIFPSVSQHSAPKKEGI